jgi:hypothetical protein
MAVLELRKLNRPKIGLTMAISIRRSTTKKIIEEASKHWDVKLLPDNIGICTKAKPLAPNTLSRTTQVPSPHYRPIHNPT